MIPIRILARLDIKGPNLVKPVHLEALRVIGDPSEHARRYYEQGADELLYVDIVASLYQRNNLFDVVQHTARDLFVPLTVGGGLRTLQDIENILRAGADKVAINTAVVHRPAFLREASRRFGSQCIVLSIEAKRRGPRRWEPYTDNGREPTGLDAVEWAQQAVDLGVGEVLVTSIDQDGTCKGFDIPLMAEIARRVPVPVIASGGAGSPEHVTELLGRSEVNAVAVASMIHYGRYTIGQIKSSLSQCGVEVRS